MAATALACATIYRFVKTRTSRPRPFAAHQDIDLWAAPLDLYSFPSGHTMHAVALGILASVYFPYLVWFLVPFACLTAVSRVVLGLHYPSDVAAGAFIGIAASSLVLTL
jgi:undecaprenyl-diphosphatase